MSGTEDGKTGNKLVSVVIPTFNRSAVLRACIDSLLRSDYTPIQIVVADNASTDDTAKMCEQCDGSRPNHAVCYFRLPENRNAAGGRNAGFRHARGDYLLFLDSDNIVEPEMIGRLVQVFESDPEMGLVAPLSVQAGTGVVWTLGSDYNFMTSMPVNRYEGWRPETVRMEALYPTRYSPNAVMVTRKAMDLAHAFDSFYGVMYEEADFGFRITGGGFKGVVCSSARTLHMGTLGREQVAALRRLGVETPMRAFCSDSALSRWSPLPRGWG